MDGFSFANHETRRKSETDAAARMVRFIINMYGCLLAAY
jgi:hypothetical protein